MGDPTSWGGPWDQLDYDALMQRLAQHQLETGQLRLRRAYHPTSLIVILLSLTWFWAHLASTPEPAAEPVKKIDRKIDRKIDGHNEFDNR